MSNNSICIKRTLYKNSKLTIEFFMYGPEALHVQNTYTVNVNPVVIFRYTNPNSIKESKIDFAENSYKMTPRNHYKMIEFFNTAVSWFYDKDLKDLFMVNENEELVFNADYKHIHTTLSKTKFEAGLLKAMPSLVIYENDRYEGIYFYINKLENLILLTKEEVETVFHIIKNFNFMNEVASTITTLNYIERTGNIVTDTSAWNKNSRTGGKFVSPFDKK